jgi:hypothetical protein
MIDGPPLISFAVMHTEDFTPGWDPVTGLDFLYQGI